MHTFKVRVTNDPTWYYVELSHLPYSCHEDWTVEDAMIDYLTDHEMIPYGSKVEIYRKVSNNRTRKIGITTLRLVQLSREYGGPEEGGWYYNHEHLVRQFDVPHDAASRLRRRLLTYVERMNSGRRSWDRDGSYDLRIGAWEQREKPHYC